VQAKRLKKQYHERAIEGALVAHIRDFFIELGQGFAFVGSQVPLTLELYEIS
jgi:predicted nuclease of restriction endonuclease-like (RecB) superfamily